MGNEIGFTQILISLICIPLGLLAGNSVVYFFNRVPEKWFLDYEEENIDLKRFSKKPRLNSHPWKISFSMIFVIILIKLMLDEWQMAIPSAIAIWVIIEIIIADKFYKIIPDQFVILLLITGFGFIGRFEGLMQPVIGLITGITPMLLIFFVGIILFKREVLGFGDVKLMGALGFLLGPMGAIFTFIVGFLTSGITFGIGLILKKIKLKDEEALGPFLGIAAIIYLVFYKELSFVLNIS